MRLATIAIAVSILVLAASAGLVYSLNSFGGRENKSVEPNGIGVFLTTSAGNTYKTYAALLDSSGRFVSSSGTFNFTMKDARGHRLFSHLYVVQQKDFATYEGVAGLGQFLGYTWNFSKAAVKPGVPLQNGSGVSEVTFTGPAGVFLRRSYPMSIPSLPKITVTGLVVMKTGSLAPYLVIYLNGTGLTAFSGDLLMKTINLVFLTIGDEGQLLVNASAIKAVISVQTGGFELVGGPPSTLYLLANTETNVTLEVKLPNESYSGPLVILILAEPWS